MAAIACCDLDRLHSLLSDDTFDLEAPWSAPPGGVRYRGPPMLLVGAEHLRVEGVLNPGEPWTPLLLACDKGHASVVEVLLRHGVAATSRDVLGVGGQGGTLPMLFYALHQHDAIHCSRSLRRSIVVAAKRKSPAPVVSRLQQRRL